MCWFVLIWLLPRNSRKVVLILGKSLIWRRGIKASCTWKTKTWGQLFSSTVCNHVWIMRFCVHSGHNQEGSLWLCLVNERTKKIKKEPSMVPHAPNREQGCLLSECMRMLLHASFLHGTISDGYNYWDTSKINIFSDLYLINGFNNTVTLCNAIQS